ncbi:RNA-binding S4 domain-containing protein [Motilimonas eburnea]|uniref:RNA-binding S4 domain-containing protein n=1 Tax=Motilimonas eburnea TaxID=1737488 RepID=UPI001E5C45D1|nr:RNA-binding S4 domain-containing protein [Motilimonas eburnea]
MSEEFEVEAIGIEVNTQPIELYKVLKIADAVSGGGEAKMAISEGYVAVNGEVETRKRCKVYDGDVIQFNGEFYLVLCDVPVAEVVVTPQPKQPTKRTTKQSTDKANKASRHNNPHPKTKNKAKAQSKPATSHQIDKQTGRREIKF